MSRIDPAFMRKWQAEGGREKMDPKKLIEAIDALFDQIPPPTTEAEIDAELREAGYDPDEVAERFRKVVADALARSPYNPQKEV